jgi:hypothetical protein
MSRAGRPLYARLLRLRHLRLTQLTSFVLFEGSVLIAFVLALAEIVNGWGVLAIPVAVAVMVKLNDVVAGVLNRPRGIAQVIRPGMVSQVAVGWSPVPVAARMTGEIDEDDAVADPDAQPSRSDSRVARGIAAVPNLPDSPNRRARPPRPGTDLPHPGGADRRARGNQGRFAS